MSDNQGALIERAIAWCRAGERSDAEYLDREFAHTLVRNPLLFVAFRVGQRDRQAEIEDLNLDLRAAEDECGTLREDNATLRQAVAELRERNRKQDEDIIDIRALIGKRDAEIAALEATIRDLTDTITTQGLKIREQAAEIERLREAVSDFLCECALQFSDERLSYETWQITAGAVDELRRALEEKP